MKTDFEIREQQILDAAFHLIIQQGYDKTTMGDVAEAAGVGRGLLYLHFSGKEDLFEALLYRETLQYARIWLDQIESDPDGGTLGSLYRASLNTVHQSPLMSALLKHDRKVFGTYLKRPGNLFESQPSGPAWEGILQAMQAAGVIRSDANLAVTAHLMDVFAYGLVGIGDVKPEQETPAFELVMETMAAWMDQMLTPPDGGNREAGKALIRQMAAASRAQFEAAQKKKNEQRRANL